MIATDMRIEPYIVAAVLIDIAVIAIALRKESRRYEKEVIIPLEVPMFAAKNIERDVTVVRL